MSHPFVYRHSGLLGTVIEVRIAATTERRADDVDRCVVNEIVRLEAVFSAFDEGSVLCRWRRGEVGQWPAEFADLMTRALDWQIRSGGRFNPLVGQFTAQWQQASVSAVLPSREQLDTIASAISAPRFVIADGVPVAAGDCSAFSLNAIAKGYVVDRALDAVEHQGAAWVSVNAGGDLAHRGSGSIRVGIENPNRPYDNEPPIAVLEVSNRAVATSGLARRGFRVADQWFGHVLDPRTGWPAERIASVSVLAPDAETADVLATIAGVGDPAEANHILDGVPGVEGFVVGREGERRATRGWGADAVIES